MHGIFEGNKTYLMLNQLLADYSASPDSFDEMLDALDHIRHDSKPTPQFEL